MINGSRDFSIGPLSFRVDEATGMLRHLRYSGHEVLRGIYPAVRDEQWGTLAAVVGPIAAREERSTLRIEMDGRVAAAGADLTWRAEIEASAAGRLQYRWTATAGRAFRTNRTGLCVLHPAETAGRPCRVEHADGRVLAGWFPSAVFPYQPFRDVRAITHVFAPGAEASVRMEGEVFETEDQRNWSDASFKTYCRPLEWPRPYEVARGERIEHTITVTILGAAPPPAPGRPAPCIRFVDTGGLPLPRMGFFLHAPIPATLRERARALCPGFLRVETSPADLTATLSWARREVEALGCGLELALRGATPDAAPPDLLPAGASVLLFDADGNTASDACVAAWKARGHQRVGTGTLNHFTELNRFRPPAGGAHALTTFGLNAQVHAFDDTSLLETLTQHAVLARHARIIGAPRPVSVSLALGPAADTADPRLHATFGALWTLASIAQLASAGAGQASYFRLHGPGGILREEPPAPIEHLLLVLAGAAEAAALPVEGFTAGEAPSVYAVLVRRGARPQLLVAHTGESPLTITVPFSGEAFPPGTVARTRFERDRLELAPRSLWQIELSA